jgi:hypothetical protein
VSLDVVIRRQVASDLGEDEPQKDERFQLLQKYGVAAPRIDRLMTKPNWMPVAEWKRKLNDWYKLTKGLVAPQQVRRYGNQGFKGPEVRRSYGSVSRPQHSQQSGKMEMSVQVRNKDFRGRSQSSFRKNT